MNIIFVKDNLFCLRIYSIMDWHRTLCQLFDAIEFNLSVKYDEWWNYHGNETPPYSSFDENEIDLFLVDNGELISKHPLLWQFKDIEALKKIYQGFINADQSIIAKSNIANYTWQHVEKKELYIVDFWANHSDYFLSTLIDYSGLILVSKSKTTIDRLEELIKRNTNIENLRKMKGKKIIA